MKKSNRHCFSPIRLLAVLLAGILLCSSMALAEIKVSINGVEQEKTETERPSHEVIPPEMMENSLPEASDIPEQNEKAEEPEAASPEDLIAKATNPAPSFTCASSLTVGKDLTVTIRAVKNAVWYYLNVYDPDGNRAYLNSTESAGKYTIDGMYFDKGKYRITLRVDYKNGSFQTASKTLTVTDPNSQRVDCDIEFMVQGEEHLINDTVKVTLSSPDAEKFAVRWGRAYYYYDSYSYYDDDDYYDDEDPWKEYNYSDLQENYEIIDAGSGEAEYSCYVPGTMFAYNRNVQCDLMIQARAYYNGKWSTPYSEIIEVEPPEWLGTPDVELPESVLAGQDVKGTINKTGYEDYFWIQVNNGEWLYCEDEEFYIPEEMLIPGKDNIIDVYSYTEQPGWVSLDEDYFSGTVSIDRDGERPAAPRLTTEKTVYWMDEDIFFTAESSEAEEIRFKYQLYQGKAWGRLSNRIVQEPENGQAQLRLSWTVPDNTTKLRVFASALIDGIWSEEAVVTVEIKKRPGWPGRVFWLPEGLTEIEDNAFTNIRTKAILIPASVTKIGEGAFSENDRLIAVEISATHIEIGEGAFRNCPNAYFYVIPGSDAEQYLIDHDLPYELDYSLLEN